MVAYTTPGLETVPDGGRGANSNGGTTGVDSGRVLRVRRGELEEVLSITTSRKGSAMVLKTFKYKTFVGGTGVITCTTGGIVGSCVRTFGGVRFTVCYDPRSSAGCGAFELVRKSEW